MSQDEFRVLLALFNAGKSSLSQRELATKLGFSVGKINRIMKKFRDSRSLENAGSRIFDNICKVLNGEGVTSSDIDNIEVVNQGLTNLSFTFSCRGKRYIYRHPGVGTEGYISRKSEAFSMAVAKRLNLDPTVIYIDPKTGWKLSHYIENARTLDYHNAKDVKSALALLRKLHQASVKSRFKFDIVEKTEALIRQTAASHKDFEDFAALHKAMRKVIGFVRKDHRPDILCHCDSYSPNFLIDKRGKMVLIDWEYSGSSDYGNDLGTFICCSDYTYEEALEVLRKYYRKKMSESALRHDIACIAMASWYWFVWAIFQESHGNSVGEYLSIWHRYTKLYSEKALSLYNDK